MEQIQADKVAASTIATKKANELRGRVEKAAASFDLFKSSTKIPKEAWYDIIKFLVTLFEKDTAPSKFNSIKKAIEKLGTFEPLYGSKWDVLMEMKLKEFQSKPSSQATSENNDLAVLCAQMHLDSNSDDDCGASGIGKDDHCDEAAL